MQEVPYRSWALVPVDTDPASTEPTTTFPPQMTNVFLEQGASLLFELAAPFGDLQIRLKTTALSAEGKESPGCRVFAGDRPGSLRELQADGWEKSVEELDAFFVVKIAGNGRDRYAKLHFQSASKLIVSGVVFQV